MVWLKKHYRNQALLNKIGTKIVDIRKQKQFTQEALAEKLGIELRQLGRIERGETNPNISTLESIATIFSMELSQLVDVTLSSMEKFKP